MAAVEKRRASVFLSVSSDSEGTLGSFGCGFWTPFGTKLGGVLRPGSWQLQLKQTSVCSS